MVTSADKIRSQTANSATYRAPAVQNAFDILNMVAESKQALTLSRLARNLDLSKSTTHGLIQALLRLGALAQDPKHKTLFLGPAVFEMALRSWNYLRVAENAQPILNELRDRIDETVFLGMFSRFKAIIMATAEATRPIKISSPPGTGIPPMAGAVGKVFLSQQTDDQIIKIIDTQGLPRFTKNTIASRSKYLAEIAVVREKGYAIDREEYLPGVNAIAAALNNQHGLPLAAWVVGFSDSLRKELMPEIISATLETAARLRTALDKGA